MKGIKAFLCAALLASALLPGAAAAIGLEASVGVWNQDPRGNLSFQEVTGADNLSIENDLRYRDEPRVFGRVKIDMPLFFPNIYLMATPMEFEEVGSKGVDFNFGDQIFNANVPFTSRLKLDHYDVGLYYSVPFLKTATLDVLNIELGLNARLLDLEAEIRQTNLLGQTFQESEAIFLPIPMVYAGVQISPVKWLSAEGEFRGISYSHNYYYDAIARAKIKPFGPLFIAGGYRYENVKVDEDDLKVRAEVMGPFGEVGLEF